MYRHRFDFLLGTLVLLLLAAPIVGLLGPRLHPLLTRGAITIFFTAVLLAAVFAACPTRRAVVVALSLAVPAILLRGLSLVFAGKGILVVGHLFDIAFLGYVVVALLKFLFESRRVTLNTIFASLCIYLLLGVLWADAYSLLDVVERNAYVFSSANGPADESMRFGGGGSVVPLYFSFVTMTTLGYGDILPVSSAARMLAVVESLTGQLYLTVLVARLVGLHISQASRERISETTRKENRGRRQESGGEQGDC